MSGDPHFDDAFQEQFLDLLRWRRDVRSFRPDPVAPAVLERLLQAACLAPSVGLSQPWRFVKVDDPRRREAIRADFTACNADALASQPASRSGLYVRLKLAGLDQAPCHIAAFADPTTEQGHGLGRKTMPETIAYSAVMAVHTVWLAARAVGLGLGWISILDAARVTEILEVCPEWAFIGYLCLGYPQAEGTIPELERTGWERRRAAGPCFLQR